MRQEALRLSFFFNFAVYSLLKFSSSLPLLFFLLFLFVFWPLSVNLHPSLWAQKNDFPQRERVQIKQVLTLFSGYLSPVFLSFSCFHYLALLFSHFFHFCCFFMRSNKTHHSEKNTAQRHRTAHTNTRTMMSS